MIPTTDDLCPEFLDMFKQFVEPYAKKYPNFRIIAFVPIKWHNVESNDCLKNKAFINYCKENKRWLKIAAHGIYHMAPEAMIKDNALVFAACQEFLKKMNEAGCSTLNAFKPPFYHWNSDSLFKAQQAGFDWFFVQDGIMDLHNRKILRRELLKLVDSHTNTDRKVNMQDRIDLDPFRMFEHESEFIIEM